MAGRVHHSAIQVHDMDQSLRFYRDGIGLDVLMDHVFEGDWPTLFDAPSTTLRSVFLGDPRQGDTGIVELVSFDAATAPASSGSSGSPGSSGTPTPAPSGAGFFLLSFYVDVDEVLDRLHTLGFGPARRLEQPAPTGTVSMASLLDPDDVRIELVGLSTG